MAGRWGNKFPANSTTTPRRKYHDEAKKHFFGAGAYKGGTKFG